MASNEPNRKLFSEICQIVEGCPIPKLFSEDAFRSALAYKPRPDDVFIATYPKCGTTWTQNILVLIFNEGKPIDIMKFFTAAPFLEMGGAKSGELMQRPGAIKVHLPYHMTPRSDQAKYIYVTRNPKDCCVSYYHHENSMPGHPFGGTFDDFFELFMNGLIHYGDYFDHLLEWYAHRNDPNVLFITYEEMKENPKESILKLASFIDDEKYAKPLQEDPQRLEDILKYSSFSYMKEMYSKELPKIFNMSPEEVEKSDLPEGLKEVILKAAKIGANKPKEQQKAPSENFIRKGIIGDWKNYFSQSQSERMDKKFKERTRGTDIPKLWEKYM